MGYPSTRRVALSILILGASASLVAGQNTGQNTGQNAGQDAGSDSAPPGANGMTIVQAFEATRTRVEPMRRSGARSSILAQSSVIVPVVAIAPSVRAYLEALAMWEWPMRFPVLLDDGSDRAREDIGRFIRAFGPERVVRLDDPDADAWGQTPRGARIDAIDRAMARSIDDDADGWRSALDAMGEGGVVSPGVVVMDPDDAPWAGGLALACGRLQPLIMVERGDSTRGMVSAARADELEREIEAGVARLGRSWREIGDEIDAVTLAMDLGVRTRIGSGGDEIAATTDRIGRAGSPVLGEGSGAGLWARAGQLLGPEARGVYQAMSALFLELDDAWIWDGYGRGGDWDRFDGGAAAPALEDAGLGTTVIDTPRNTMRIFEISSSRAPLDASLLLMNTKGTQSAFDLPGAPSGSGRPGDLPVLTEPAALHLVHSFSLQSPRRVWTLGGRWLERGVYLYAGSVHEPYLAGFVPTPDVARRLAGRLAFSAAVHYDNAPMWKIAVLGDPLKTLGPVGRRAGAEPPGITGTDLAKRASARLEDGDFAGGVEDLAMLGRDADVGRLVAALVRERPEKIDARTARAAIPGALRAGRHGLVLDLFERLDDAGRADPTMLDMLWLAGRHLLERDDDRRALSVMRANLRPAMRVRDATELAQYLKRDSLDSGLALLESMRGELKGHKRKRLDRAIKRLKR